MLQEFKKFIAKGNVMELAVGVIMATYFGAIVKSMVDHMLMPLVGYFIGGIDFADKKVVLKDAVADTMNEAGEVVTAGTPEVAIMYGTFINTVITFFIVAFVIFLVVKAYNKMKDRMEKKEAEAPAAPPAPTKEEVLLTEIRDLLKNK